jgi:DNA-binding transcriptional ArsR family regulator
MISGAMPTAAAPDPNAGLDAVLHALADPTRRAILRRLAAGEARVTDVAAPFPLSLNAVSKHVRTLERAGLVRRRRRGKEHLLSFDPAPLAPALAWIAGQQAAWDARLVALDGVLGEGDDARADAPHDPEDARR